MGNRTDYFNRLNKPTLLQIRYLQALVEIEPARRKRGAVAAVASRCGVNHAAVSRFFKSCHEAGYLNDGNVLTGDGEEWLSYYTKLIDRIEEYLRCAKVPEQEFKAAVQTMVENMDDHVLQLLLDDSERPRPLRSSATTWEQSKKRSPLYHIVERGNYKVGFKLLKLDQFGSQVVKGLSMADAGFEKPAMLKANNRGLFLELTACELTARSRATGELMQGHMSSLKYMLNGELMHAQIRKGKVLIPLDACEYDIRSNSGVTGMIAVTFGCSVGRLHMPESAALLVFWL